MVSCIMEFSFVIPTYNNVNMTMDCIDSIKNLYPQDRIIVSDDGSNENIRIKLKELSKQKGFDFYTSIWNNGFSHACNRGIHASTTEYVCLINNDVILTEDIKTKTEKAFEDDNKIGAVGYLLYYPDGRVQHGGHKFAGGVSFEHYDHGLSKRKASICFKDRYEVGVTGALVTLRRSMLDEIGSFKAGYFLAFEDSELCLRVWHCGWKVYYLGSVSAIHKEGETRGSNDKAKKERNTFEVERKSAIQYNKDVTRYNIDETLKKVARENKRTIGHKDITIKRTIALGDCIMATGVVNKIKKDNPESEIIVASNYDYPFLNNPNVSKIIRPQNIDPMSRLIDLDMTYEKDPKKPAWCAYADAIGLSYTPDEILPKLYDNPEDGTSLSAKLKRLRIFDNAKLVVIHAGVSWASRTLPKGIWQEVIEHLSKDYTIIIVGTKKDLDLDTNNNIKDLRELFTLGEIRELIKKAKCFIGTDNSIFHIAQTTETPVVAVFGSSNPDYRIHRTERTEAVIPNSICRFCQEDMPGITSLTCKTGDNRCIKSIGAMNIIDAVGGLI